MESLRRRSRTGKRRVQVCCSAMRPARSALPKYSDNNMDRRVGPASQKCPRIAREFPEDVGSACRSRSGLDYVIVPRNYNEQEGSNVQPQHQASRGRSCDRAPACVDNCGERTARRIGESANCEEYRSALHEMSHCAACPEQLREKIQRRAKKITRWAGCAAQLYGADACCQCRIARVADEPPRYPYFSFGCSIIRERRDERV